MINLNDKFKPLFESDKRYFILTGGRGSSKSFHAKAFEALLAYERGHKILDTRYTLKSAQKSTIPEFIEKIDLLETPGHFSIKNDTIMNTYSGSEVFFSGIKTSSGNQTANLKSLQGVTTWVLDEAEELVDEQTFDTINLSIRQKGVQNRIILILNPTTKDHWIWERWFEGYTKYITIDGFDVPISTHPDICNIHTTYLDNLNNLHEDYIYEMRKLKEENPDKYRHIVLGGWREKAEGVIFDNWLEGEFDESLPYVWGMDFGYSIDPTTLIKVAIDETKKKIHLKEYLYTPKLSETEIISILANNIPNQNDLIVADSAETRLIDAISVAGYNIVPSQKGPGSVTAGIKKIQGYDVIIDPDSHNAKKEFNNYAWHDKRSGVPQDKWNHIIDPLRYVVDELSSTTPFFFG